MANKIYRLSRMEKPRQWSRTK